MNKITLFGAGSLGRRVGKVWKSKFPEDEVFAVTQTPQHHLELKELGFKPFTIDEVLPQSDFVLIAVPPSKTQHGMIEKVLQNWTRKGKLAFISSTGVYKENSNGKVTERSEVEKGGKLVQSEADYLSQGGMVLRLAGLYDKERGPHIEFLKKERSKGSADGFMNLIHYDDAAELSVQTLLSGEPRNCYLGCDETPILRKDFVALVFKNSPKPDRLKYFAFEHEGNLGKSCDNQWTQQSLNWKPQWTSFESWISKTDEKIVF